MGRWVSLLIIVGSSQPLPAAIWLIALHLVICHWAGSTIYSTLLDSCLLLFYGDTLVAASNNGVAPIETETSAPFFSAVPQQHTDHDK
jgi:hypothetical protein